MHHKVVGNFRSEADVRSLYYRRWSVLPKFATHGRSVKSILTELRPGYFENEPDFRPMHAKFERLLSKSLTALEVMAYYLVVHTGPGVRLGRGISELYSRFRCGSVSRSSHTSDKIATPMNTLQGAWRYRINAGTGWLGVNTLWLCNKESLTCNFCLSMAAPTTVWADPRLRYASILLWRLATNKQQYPAPATMTNDK